MRLNLNFINVFIVLALLCTSCQSPKATKQADSAQSNWQLAILAYTFKDGTFFEAVDKAKALGIPAIGIFPGQEIGEGIAGKMDYNMDTETRTKVKALLKARDMQLADIGVISPENGDDWEKLFQFAKEMEIPTIVSEPDPKLLGLIGSLCEQYQIKVAIHNHAAPSTYWNPDSLMQKLDGQSEWIGVCADVGHWLRSGLNPLKSLKTVNPKLKSLHFKDVSMESADAKDVVWGKGNIPIADLLQTLQDSSFTGTLAIEYEGDLNENPNALNQIMESYNNHIHQLNPKH